MAKFKTISCYKLKAKTITPLHIGNSDGTMNILLNSDNKPYIQANSIAGAFGDYCSKKFGDEIKNELFGNANGQGSKSKIVFSDGNIFENADINLRPRVKINGARGVAEDKELFSVQVLEKACIEFNISIYSCEDYSEYTEILLSAFNSGEILLGGQKTNGCGRFEITSVEKIWYDLTDANDRNNWLNNTGEFIDITDKIKNTAINNFCNITMSANILDSIIVKSGSSITSVNNKFVNSESIKNSKGYFIPGSSIKGVIKNHIYSIANYLKINRDELSNLFGREADPSIENDTGVMGKVIFEDATITQSKSLYIHRVKIDKLTGGAYNKGKFDEMPVTGRADIVIRVNKSTKHWKAAAALVILALRDLANGVISLGALSSVGRGYVRSECIMVDGNNCEDVINEYLIDLGGIRL
ncbi:MAG: RAMP superfamily CRISPR-associated protein [Lachnospirales bacterium]